MITPSTPEQWQEAVNLADLHMHLESARQYGLIQGGPRINQPRCELLLKNGKANGYEPNWTDVDLQTFIRSLQSLAKMDPDQLREQSDELRKAFEEVGRIVEGDDEEDGAPTDPAEDRDTPPEGSPAASDGSDADAG